MRSVFEYLDYRKYFKEAFKERKAVDPKVSYRNLAESLGLDGSNFHKILAGQAHLPARCQSRILDFLGLGNREAEYFRLLVMFARERGAKARMEILSDLNRPPRLADGRDLAFGFGEFRLCGIGFPGARYRYPEAGRDPRAFCHRPLEPHATGRAAANPHWIGFEVARFASLLVERLGAPATDG